MQPNELKAVLAKTREVAIYPAHIEVDLPTTVAKRNRRGILMCPRGLVKATVIEDGHKWVEKRPVAMCGDQEYEIDHRNGVLVELPFNDDRWVAGGQKLYIKDRQGKKAKEPYPHTEVVERDGQKFVRMIVSRKAIMAAWGEYALMEAKHQKEADEQKKKYDRIYDATAAIMGVTRDELAARNEDGSPCYLGTKYVTTIEISLDQAEKIFAMLTDEQKKKLRAA